jgi:hypothetical protein
MQPPRGPSNEELGVDRAFMHQRTLFATSAAMVGVCLTAISLILVVEHLSSVRVLSRIVLGIDSLVFLATTLISFGAMRAHVRGRPSRLHPVAAATMLLGLIGAAAVCVMLVFTLV